jgi:UPF0042 nucleotide-binding protein
MKLLIVSGISGSGKSIALQVLEDLGFYCIDNLPVGLIPVFAAQITSPSQRTYTDAAVGVDVRNLVDDLSQFPSILDEIRGSGLDCDIIFLDADEATLLKRFSETRRRHPLTGQDIPLAEAIEVERELLQSIAENADWRIDTTHTTVHQLRDLIKGRFTSQSSKTLSLLFLSFGYKHGIPADADFVFDIRCLPNPHWDPQLRPLTGRDADVVSFLESQPLVREMKQQLQGFLENWLPRFEAENRSYMTVAIGCTGGRHRSVYLAEQLRQYFTEQLSSVLVRHRELS